jgi:voltage-dependent calcium channel L type alpha-1D
MNFNCRFRLICHRICNHPYFGNVVLACIIISSAMLAAEDPLDFDKKRNEVSLFINYSVFADIFHIINLHIHMKLLVHFRYLR